MNELLSGIRRTGMGGWVENGKWAIGNGRFFAMHCGDALVDGDPDDNNNYHHP